MESLRSSSSLSLFAGHPSDRGWAAGQRARGASTLRHLFHFDNRRHDLEADFLTHIAMVPVMAANYALAKEPSPLTREILEQQIQLVVTVRSPLTQSLKVGIYGARIWRFADFSTRLDYLLAGFG